MHEAAGRHDWLRTEEELRALVEVATRASSDDILAFLVVTLARTLGIKSAFVCELADAERRVARTVALCEDGEIKQNFEYTLAGTPCESVYEQSEIFYPTDLRRLFPADAYLDQMKGEGYLGQAFRDSNGDLIGHIGFIHDHSLSERCGNHPLFRAFAARARAELERRHSEEKLRRQRRELAAANASLERANRELEEFAYVASHDLQEPIRKLVSFSELLRKDAAGDLSSPALRDLQFIDEGARRMQQLVKDLLDLSRAQSAPIHREPVAVDDCVDRALDALALRVQETSARITRDALPEVTADATLLTTVYQNLLENALKFADPLPPTLELTAEDAAEGCVLGVADRGPGIPSAQRESIFQPFRRLGGTGVRRGSGIGLSICRKAVERHGGRIWVEERRGGGTHFKFTLGE